MHVRVLQHHQGERRAQVDLAGEARHVAPHPEFLEPGERTRHLRRLRGVPQYRILQHDLYSAPFGVLQRLEEATHVAQGMQQPDQICTSLACRNYEVRDVTDTDGVRQLTLRGRDNVSQGRSGTGEHEPRREDERQKPSQRPGKALADLLHDLTILGATSLPISAEVPSHIVLGKVVVQAVVQDHQLRPSAPALVLDRPDVDVPGMRVGVHTPVDEDHLGEGAAKKVRALERVEPRFR
mmetsp:Transcript_68410/g.198338  ORF Transcript_68410/g.198338 Transcript_68410/m.198338 type:complete len:238 (-) Transcript_68410:921-1634(-)